MKITCTAVLLLIQTLQSLASNDSAFVLSNKETGFCLVQKHGMCASIRWTTGDRLFLDWWGGCIGVQGKSAGSEISIYDCDENSELQKWECKNGTVLALKGQELYIELTADNTAVLSGTIGPNNHLTIPGTSSGACSRTYRELYTIEGNANGRICMFPFFYKNRWYIQCTERDSADGRSWCAIETRYDHELWGFCPTNSKEQWKKHSTTGEQYQLNIQSALTWNQAETSCKQQSASLLSITDPHQQAYVSALLQAEGSRQGDKFWSGMMLDSEHGWQWSNGRPYRYLNWDSGHPLAHPGHSCGIIDGAVQYTWQSSQCTKKLGYICYSEGVPPLPTEAPDAGFCSPPWIPYNAHCFYLDRTKKTWSDAQRECRKEGGDLVSIRNVEDQSFVISQLGYASTDELWIGLNDRSTERLFDWSDHTPVSFTSWEFGKPAVLTDQEDCVLVRGENGNWADRVCNEKHGFICMKTSASEPTGDEVEQNVGCRTGWKRHGSYCYFVGTETKTFEEAKTDCEASDSYLADVSNGVDNAFLVSLVGLRPEKYFWLGLSNQRHIDFFAWTNGNSVRYTHWNSQMPGHQQGCVAITTGILAGLWDVLPCTTREKYICKHLAEGAVLTPAPPTAPSPSCADGWQRVPSRNFCYKLFAEGSDKRTWYEARDYCRAIGGDLLSIHSSAELQVGGRNIYRGVWIGLSAPDPVTGFEWSDGSPVNFQHWIDGQPDNRNNAESCVEFYPFFVGWRNSWNDIQCEKYNGWLCQIRAGVIPKPPPAPVSPDYNKTSDGWLQWQNNEYFINVKSMAMEDARSFCQKNHADMVTINSEAENAFLWKQASQLDGPFWIGLSIDLDGTYGWMDSSQVTYQRWSEGQPDFKNYDENCAVMSSYSGFWHDYNCGYEFKSICKRSDSPSVNATVKPTEVPMGGCPPRWKKFKSKCYSIILNQMLTWDDARKQCQSMGGNLASIPSRHVEAFLVSQMADSPTSDVWIGLRTVNHGPFHWTDGQPRPYVNFHFNEFYRFYDQQDMALKKCVVINTNSSGSVGKWYVKSCNDTNGYICLRKVDPLMPDSPEPTTSTGYVKILNDTIKVVTQQMNWEEAKKHCELDGAKLASLRNEWSQAYVELLVLNLKAPLWIGMNSHQTSEYFRFIDGWRMSISRWGMGEPSRDRPCVYVDVKGKWKTAHCNETMNSVCMKSTDVPPAELSRFPGVCPEDPETPHYYLKQYWLPFKGYCYVFVTGQERTWADAAASCVQHGGLIASIEDPVEQEFIEEHLKLFEDRHTTFWIGLYKNRKGEWLWLDRTVMDYTNWGEDLLEHHTYGAIATSNGLWRTDAHQWFGRPYICKTPKVIQTQTPTPSSPSVLDPRHSGHVALVTGLVITGIIIVAIITFLIFKRSTLSLPILQRITAFDNPLFFNKEQPKPDVVDTNILVENMEEEEHPETPVTM